MIVKVKICPCCQEESKPKNDLLTVEDYKGNGVQLDEQNRIEVLCDDCLLQYKWDLL